MSAWCHTSVVFKSREFDFSRIGPFSQFQTQDTTWYDMCLPYIKIGCEQMNIVYSVEVVLHTFGDCSCGLHNSCISKAPQSSKNVMDL